MTESNNNSTEANSLRPSLLDYVAQAGLNSLFDPIFRRLVHRLADQNKEFKVLKEWFDEFFTLANSLVQFYYLKNYGATFAENYYGLQRIPIHGGFKLGRKELWLSLFAESICPYLLTKLRNSADKIIFDELPRTNLRKKIMFMKFVIYLNDGVNILQRLWRFIQMLRYLGEKTNYMCPAHCIARVNLVYSNEALFKEVGFKNIVPNFVAKSIELFAFLAQFFHLWKENDGGNFNSLPIPPAPEKHPVMPLLGNKCPICRKPRKIDTVLTVSGFVFCFECITNYLSTMQECPVTELPATLDQLVRVRTTV